VDGATAGGALITGAGRGLGFEIARVLARRGLAVHVTDVDADAASRAAAALGGGAFASALDVRDGEACGAAAAATRERAGSLEVWVNNAGVLVTGPAWEQDPHTRRLMLEVNALGTINGTLAALELMREQSRGHIINIVSLAGLVAAPGEAVYGASKHAAIAFSIGTLTDLRLAGVRGIHISCVCPDGIWTPMLQDKLDDRQAAASFSGVLLLPAQVAERVGDLLDHPRPVLTIPRWRGAVVRLFDVAPRLALSGVGPVLAYGRLQQRLFKRRVARGRWPPKTSPEP
jgi:NAD(P)-dependent dehydrogenase (short-subunit alcohol dehydrogenase family)